MQRSAVISRRVADWYDVRICRRPTATQGTAARVCDILTCNLTVQQSRRPVLDLEQLVVDQQRLYAERLGLKCHRGQLSYSQPFRALSWMPRHFSVLATMLGLTL